LVDAHVSPSPCLTRAQPADKPVNRSVDELLYSCSAISSTKWLTEAPVQSEEDSLDDVFHALANRTRRALLRTLATGPARVTELAAPHGISVNAVSKHLFVLERAGLIRRTRSGNIQTCVLEAAPMATAEEWIRGYRRFWSGKIDQLAAFVERRGN
jgi:DNA-binding transcriptional ArsR family regulator